MGPGQGATSTIYEGRHYPVEANAEMRCLCDRVLCVGMNEII